MADTFTWCPTTSSSAVANTVVRRSQFGDGYAQSAADGINAIRRTWSVEFVVKESVALSILSFLDSNVGKSFIWNAPLIGNAFFYCDTYSSSPSGNSVWTISATFEQTYQP